MRFSNSLSKTALSLGLSLSLACAAFSGNASAATGNEPDLNELARYASIDRALLDQAITQATYQQKIIDAMNRPYEGKPWHMYRKLFITDKRINGGVDFYLKHEQTLLAGSKKIRSNLLKYVAIIGVETFYGQNLAHGKF